MEGEWKRQTTRGSQGGLVLVVREENVRQLCPQKGAAQPDGQPERNMVQLAGYQVSTGQAHETAPKPRV